jgi:predicted histone-like DNA-binding protein
MAIRYKKIKQTIRDKNGEEKEVFYARSCERDIVDINKLADHIASYTVLSSIDVRSVLMALPDKIPEYLLDNKSVELGDLGIISLHLSSRCEAKEEDVNKRSIKEVKVQYRANKRIKDRLKRAKFELAK